MEKFLGFKLRKAREALGLTQASFARAVGLSSEYISLLEYGKRTPSFGTLQKISAYLNRDISYFFYEKPALPDGFTVLFRAEAVDDRSRKELQKFRRYCDDYLRLEAVTERSLELAPLYGPAILPERMAEEERRRLGLGNEPIRDIFALLEANGCRILRLPMPDESRVSGVFIYLEQKRAAFALINSSQALGRQAFSAAHEYCHYLRDRNDSPVIDSPDVFVDEYASLYHPREQFAQAFAAHFLMPPAKIKEIIEKDLRVQALQRISFDQVLYLKRYFGVSTMAMFRTLRQMGYIGRTQLEDYVKIDPDNREKEIFGNLSGGKGEKGAAGSAVSSAARAFARIRRSAVPSDRYKLLQKEAARKVTRAPAPEKPVQKKLPIAET
jgi:Zn-dependent peptidase ImmA (M78 family)